MSNLQKCKAIILKKLKYGESDLILHCLNSEGAQLHFIAKGALRSKKRFGGGVLEPTHYIEALFHEKKIIDGDELHVLQEARLIMGFEHLRTDYDRLQLALYFVNRMDKVSLIGSVQSGELFDLLGNALQKLQEKDLSLLIFQVHYDIRLLFLLGYLNSSELFADFLHYSLHQTQQIQCDPIRLNEIKEFVKFEYEKHFGFFDSNK